MPDETFYAAAISTAIEATGVSIAPDGADWIVVYALTRLPGLQEAWDGDDGDAVRDEIAGFDWAQIVDAPEMFRFFSYMERRSEDLRQTRFESELAALEALLDFSVLSPEVPAQVNAVRKSFASTRLCLIDP